MITSQEIFQTSIQDVPFHPIPSARAFDDQPVPLVRIYTCGGLRIEVLQHPADSLAHAQYHPLPSERLCGRGAAPGQTLLKVLISGASRYRSKDWLSTYLSPTTESLMKRVDVTASQLRGLLCPAYLQNEQRDVCRKRLVRYVYASTDFPAL